MSCAALIVPNKSLLFDESFRGGLVCKQPHPIIQCRVPLSHVYFGPAGHSFIRPDKKKSSGRGPEISAARELDHDDQANDFLNADSSKPWPQQNVEAPHRAESRSGALSPEARPALKTAIRSSESPTLNKTLFFVFWFQRNLFFFFWQIEHVSEMGCVTFRSLCMWSMPMALHRGELYSRYATGKGLCN
jgi:hypothetical protein